MNTPASATELEPLTVTPTGRALAGSEQDVSVSVVNDDALRLVAATHPSEIGARVAGVWLSRGSGQEQLTAIRSPVLTGAGSCGAFLVLEHGIPIRPPGFCNVNQLFEVNTEQAPALEIMRGPGTALYGSNALHGIISVPSPGGELSDGAALESGPDDFYRLSAQGAGQSGATLIQFRAHGEHDGGFRNDSGYGQGKLNLDIERAADLGFTGLHIAATLLNQETAGFIRGFNAFRDPAVAKSNPNPEAFRDAKSARVSANFSVNDGSVFSPYFRWSQMQFLQHFLPGQPLEKNGQRSAGFLARSHFQAAGGDWIAGFDLDLMSGYLSEVQATPITSGSPFLIATRPAGTHYDYDVDALNLAPYLRAEWQLNEKTRLAAGLRLEHQRYDYDNRSLDGNTDDQGVPCGFGGCLFNRPADRDDEFTTLAPKLSVHHRISPDTTLFASARRGFRVPQATELYRLQRQQSVADLDTELLDAIELGWRRYTNSARVAATAYYMHKRNVILRDADGFNVSDGRTRHAGVEFQLDYSPTDDLTISLNADFSQQRYDFDRLAGGGEVITSGNDIDTAPGSLGTLRIQWAYHPRGTAEIEWQHLGSYYLDAANAHRYPGHDLAHVRFYQRFAGGWSLAIRVTNLLDRAYAERADFAFGDYRYFPGRERNVYVQLGFGV